MLLNTSRFIMIIFVKNKIIRQKCKYCYMQKNNFKLVKLSFQEQLVLSGNNTKVEAFSHAWFSKSKFTRNPFNSKLVFIVSCHWHNPDDEECQRVRSFTISSYKKNSISSSSSTDVCKLVPIKFKWAPTNTDWDAAHYSEVDKSNFSDINIYNDSAHQWISRPSFSNPFKPGFFNFAWPIYPFHHLSAYNFPSSFSSWQTR